MNFMAFLLQFNNKIVYSVRINNCLQILVNWDIKMVISIKANFKMEIHQVMAHLNIKMAIYFLGKL